MTTIYNGYFIDKEKDDFTKRTIFTIWDKKGVICLKTTNTLEQAKRYIDSL